MYWKFLVISATLVCTVLMLEVFLLIFLRKYKLKRKSRIYKDAEKSLEPDLNTIKKLEIK